MRAEGDCLLEVSGVTLQYKTARHLVTATYNVDFNVREGDRYVILGPSGCGKSTLLKAVGGFMAPVEGSVRIRGRDVREPGPDRMMVFQKFEQLMPWKTVEQNVLFPMKVTHKFPRKEARQRALSAIGKVRLTPFREVYPHMLSGGMKMRVAIARVTRGPVITDQGAADMSSRQNLVANADGSVDLYFGPTKPAQAQNWVKTISGKGWFPYFRFYGPKEAYFDKSWQLNDIELVSAGGTVGRQ